MEDIDVQNMWFQQDGFNNRIISRRTDVNWPPRSCDLTTLDFFLWGFLKSKDYADNPQRQHHLANITN